MTNKKLKIYLGIPVCVLILGWLLYWPAIYRIERVDLGDGYVAEIYAERDWELSQTLSYEIKRHGVVLIPREGWASSLPSKHPKSFKVYQGGGGRFIAIVNEKTSRRGVVIFYDKLSNKIVGDVRNGERYMSPAAASAELEHRFPHNLKLYIAESAVLFVPLFEE